MTPTGSEGFNDPENNTNIPYAGFAKGRPMELDRNDIDMLKARIPEIDYISPQSSKGSFGSAGELMSRTGKNGTYSLNGDSPIGNKISEKKLLFSRFRATDIRWE